MQYLLGEKMDRKEFEFERATKNTVRTEISIRFKGTEEGEGYCGVGVDSNRITFVVRLR